MAQTPHALASINHTCKQFNAHDSLASAAKAAAHFPSLEPALESSTAVTLQLCLTGVAAPKLPSRISLFAHVLFGASRQTQSFGFFSPGNSVGDNSVLSHSYTGFATAIGGGVDIKIIPHISIRAVQADYLATRLHGNTQNQPRISTGIVLRF